MLKLVRNALSDCEVFIDEDGDRVEWRIVSLLQDPVTEGGLASPPPPPPGIFSMTLIPLPLPGEHRSNLHYSFCFVFFCNIIISSQLYKLLCEITCHSARFTLLPHVKKAWRSHVYL